MPGNGLPSPEATRERPRNRRDQRTPEELRAEAARLFSATGAGALPEATEAEAGLLGALLLDCRVLGDVVGIIKGPGDFVSLGHGEIYRTMVDLYDRDSGFDIIKLRQALFDRNVLEAVGGLDYLVSLARATPSATFALEYARIVREKSIVRALLEAASAIVVEAHTGGLPARELLQAAEARIFAIAQQSEQIDLQDLKSLLDEALEQVEANEGRMVTGVSTGFHELDEYTSGFQPGEFIVLAARPSMGKTALALNLAENIAADGRAVAVFSLEMSRQQLVQRLLCARSGIDSHRFRRGMLQPEDYQRLLTACGELSTSRMFIDDTPGLTLLQLRSKARRLKERENIDFVVIDYLQLMSTGGRSESRQIEVSEMSRGVKAMARELRLPVVCLSQLNRAAEQREGHRPRMSDLRESGSIEQDADVVMMLHREDYYHQNDPNWALQNPDKMGIAELILAKQRNGPTGVVRLQWNSATTRFGNPTRRVPPGDWSADRGGGHGGPRGGGAVDGGQRSRSAPPPDAGHRGAFHAAPATGPARDHRDGGGPDRGEDEIPI